MIDGTTSPPAESRAPLRILLLAEEAAGVQVLRMLAERGHVVVAVMTSGAAWPAFPGSRPRRAAALPVLACRVVEGAGILRARPRGGC